MCFVASQSKSFMEKVGGITIINQTYKFEIFSLIAMIQTETANLEIRFYLDYIFSKFKVNLGLAGDEDLN